jgi:hypothetical protein
LAEAPDPAELVEDRRAEKEHREFAKMWTSSRFGPGVGSGCTDLLGRTEEKKENMNKRQQSKPTEENKED